MGKHEQARLQQRLGAILTRHVEPLFPRGSRLTLLVRMPGRSDADVMVTSDSMSEVSAMVERLRERARPKPGEPLA